MTKTMIQKSLSRYGGGTRLLGFVNSASFFQVPSCRNISTQANRQDYFRKSQTTTEEIQQFACLWLVSLMGNYCRCVAGRELYRQPGKQTIKQLLSGLRGRVLLKNSTGIEVFVQLLQNNLLVTSFISSFYRTCDLATELNFHLTEYQTGRLGKLDEVAEPSRQVDFTIFTVYVRFHMIIIQVVVGGEVIEYISMEMGVIRLTGGEVALFHLSQVSNLKHQCQCQT